MIINVTGQCTDNLKAIASCSPYLGVEMTSVFSLWDRLSARAFTEMRSWGAGAAHFLLTFLGKNLLLSSFGWLADFIHSCGRSTEIPVFSIPVSLIGGPETDLSIRGSQGSCLLPSHPGRGAARCLPCAFLDHSQRKFSDFLGSPSVKVSGTTSRNNGQQGWDLITF